MSASRSWVIGSSPNCDIVVTQPNVSRSHCRLIMDEGRLFLEDLESTNGTFVNGVGVSGRVEVSLSDRIVLGSNVPFPWPDEVQGIGVPLASRQGKERILAGMESVVTPLDSEAPLVEPKILSDSISMGTGRRQIRIGRDASNDLVLDYPMVSSRHALLTIADGHAILEDLKSTNGTAINTPGNTIDRHPITEGDVVFFGSLRIPAAKLLAANPKVGSQADEVFTFSGNEMTFGRSPDCDQVLEYPMVSGRHARVFRLGPQLMVEDLQSANGTFVNGSRIHRPTPINPGDSIGLGSYTFKLCDGGNFEKRDFRGNVTIEARNISIAVGGKRLIENVSLTIYPSEFVGLMGPSGAGKTTLMNALNGYTPPTSGQVLFNGQDLYADYAQFASSLGYVPQDDIIHRDLTVGQALYYTAKLRLPPDTSDREIEDRITRVLKQLGLESARDVLVGSPERKGISGGQRKRVNLAMELLTDPSVLFLDEPTSGLSSEDALMVMKVLRELADSGKAILLTIHQPSLEAYRLMDNLVLIGKDQNSTDPGQLVYYGPAYPDAVKFFNPMGLPNQKPGTEPLPDEVLRGFAKQATKTWVKSYDNSQHKKNYVTDRAGKTATPTPKGLEEPQKPVGIAQWLTLSKRYFTIKLKDVINTAILLAQAPIVAILVVLVFGEDASQKLDPPDGLGARYWSERNHLLDWQAMAQKTSTSIFLMGLAALWFGCSNAAREIVGEWAIYHRERMVNLKLPSYLGSKFAVLGGLCLLQCMILVAIVDAGCGLEGDALLYLLILWVVSLVGVGMGLLISSLAKTSEVAIALLPIVLLPMVILGGMMKSVHDMNGMMRFASNFTPTRWAYESMALLEAKERPEGKPVLKIEDEKAYNKLNPQKESNTDSEADEEASSEYYRRPDIAHQSFPETERVGTVVSLFVLLGMFAVLVAANLWVLRARDVH